LALEHRISYIVKDKAYGAALIAAPIFYFIYGAVFFDGSLFSASFVEGARQLILLIILYPVIEELAFRGFIQGQLINMLGKRPLAYGISLPNIITSCLFSLVHLINHHLILSILVFFPSLVFGYFRDKYESTKPGIGLHIFYNAGYYLLFWSSASYGKGDATLFLR